MPHDNDEPRDLASRLRKFNLFDTTPIESVQPRDPIEGPALLPGMLERKSKFQKPGILGWEDLFDGIKPVCRWCGTEMYFYEENDEEILYACPYPGCRNNPNTPEHVRLKGLKIAKNKAREDHF